MNIAVVLTVKNEARLLRQNVYYHLGIGIKKIYIYFDNTDDGGRDLVENIKNVECLDSIFTEKYDHLSFLKKFTENKINHHTARQCLNSYDAEQRCLKDGMDWLISIDADEFFLPPNEFKTDALNQLFEDIDAKGHEILRFGVYEVIPRKMKYKHVALEETLFKTKKNFESKFDQIYFEIVDPYSEEKIISHYWLSHNMGKCAIKTGNNLIPHNVHKYKSRFENKSANVVFAGHILHYFQYDADDFIKKSENFKLHPIKYLSGKQIGRLKNLYITLVNDPKKSRQDILQFYEENLLFNKRKVARLYKTRVFNILPRKESAVIEITRPSEVLQAYKHLL